MGQLPYASPGTTSAAQAIRLRQVLSAGPKPAPTTTEIEVGRHALRSFKYKDGKLMSLYKDFSWDGGVAVATCLALNPCGECPGFDCNCGLFGSVTMDHLMSTYKEHAAKGIAVIAAEGMTLIGDTGLRTSAARIVAYWADADYQQHFTTNCPDAKGYDQLNCMLADYQFEPWEGEFPPVPRSDADYLGYLGHAGLRRVRSMAYPDQSYRLGTFSLTIEPLVKDTATAGGLAALKLLMDGTIG